MTKRVELQPPLAATSVDVDSYLGQPRARGAREASIHPAMTTLPVIKAQCEGTTRCVMPRQTCPRPNGFGRNLRSRTRWFTGFCNSHQVSHFTMFFIDARAEISVAESRFRLQKKHRSSRRMPRMGCEGQAIDSSIPWRFPRRGSLVARRARWGARAGEGGRRSCGVQEHPARADFPVVKYVRGVVLLCRQIAPPTKNDHAPPPIESRKSSQSVNPHYVLTCSELAVRRAGKAPEGTVPSPSPGRHAVTRSRRGISSSSPPTADGRIPLVRTSSELAVRRAGKAPEGTVPSPSPGRHAATRSRRGSSSSSPPTADGFGTGTPVPSPQSQSFSRSYGSILPTSLAYIVPSTRGCSPWRPDAVMSTTGRGRHSVLRIFKGRRERTGHHATCGALPAAGPYLRLSRFQGGQAVKQKI
ncbi:hypothetical protein CQW23_33097 [Capsicum baccatum]|uniref:Protein TAR1 n=1 Tax=Capsicum baccatum TaxID=33114 RepID=A0A2G2V2W1_CAPBA|nr:hypothetical protein CQW23_33097 [Capsicum baccatum]